MLPEGIEVDAFVRFEFVVPVENPCLTRNDWTTFARNFDNDSLPYLKFEPSIILASSFGTP